MRGYSFNINSGAVESLELDSFGIAIIPSSLVREDQKMKFYKITAKAELLQFQLEFLACLDI